MPPYLYSFLNYIPIKLKQLKKINIKKLLKILNSKRLINLIDY
jgi:hypothetical protein